MTNATQQPTILVIDDDEEIRYSLSRVLSSRDFRVATAASGEEGVAYVKKNPPDVVFLDIRMGGIGGIETLQHLRAAQPRLLVILMTAFGTAQTAIEAMKYGAFDYIVKPFDAPKVLALADNALKAHADLRAAGGDSPPKLNREDYQEGIVGSSPAMQEVFKIIGQVTASDVTVMITGESGTGKELVARSIWQHSHRAAKPFLAVNCAAIPDNLIESELFGHEKGAFTGATAQRIGRFEQADGGTIFLDEIGDMAPATQTKILRVLQQGEIQRVGGAETLRVDVRVLAATNKDPEAMIRARTFREDLYYRLNVVRIHLPPLRERAGDIPSIADFCLQNLGKGKKARVTKFSPEALAVLTRHRWPGNVRELENVIHRSAVIAQGDTILLKDLPAEIRGATGPAAAPPDASAAPFDRTRTTAAENSALATAKIVAESVAAGAPALTVERALDFLEAEFGAAGAPLLPRLERELARRALAALNGDETAAAQKLGVSKAALKKLLGAAG